MIEGIIQWSPGVTLEQIEKEVILTAFRHYRGNKTATSNALGIAIRTLDNKLEKYEFDSNSEKDRKEDERKKREDFLARSRGQLNTNIDTGERIAEKSALSRANEGVRMESAEKSSAQPQMSMPKSKEIQGVLSAKTPIGSDRRTR